MYARTGAGPPPTITLLQNAGSDPGIVCSCGTPTRPTAPPGRAMLIAVCIDCSVPTHSRIEWTPKPAVSSRTRPTASAPRSLTTSVAPNSLASAIRSGWRPRMMICSAPSRRAAITAHKPRRRHQRRRPFFAESVPNRYAKRHQGSSGVQARLEPIVRRPRPQCCDLVLCRAHWLVPTPQFIRHRLLEERNPGFHHFFWDMESQYRRLCVPLCQPPK